MKKVAMRTISNRDPRTIMTIPYSGNGSVIKHRKSTVRLKTYIFYSLNVIQFTYLFVKKVAIRTISNRDPRTIKTIPYSGKSSEINHRYSTV